MTIGKQLSQSLWRIYNRPTQPTPWAYGGNLPWDEPTFSERMLQEHLDETHGAASRTAVERQLQIEWINQKLGLVAGQHVFDVTCGPGLYAAKWAQQNIRVTGIDFAPASIRYAQEVAQKNQIDSTSTFIQADIREWDYPAATFDAAVLLYGQLAVMSTGEAQNVLTQIAQSLRPGSKLCLEMLNPVHIDRTNSTWWFTDDTGIWGTTPFLLLGERQWYETEQLSMERYHVVHLETGSSDEIVLCDQAYTTAQMTALLERSGFTQIDIYPAWDNLALYDKDEWIVYIATV